MIMTHNDHDHDHNDHDSSSLSAGPAIWSRHLPRTAPPVKEPSSSGARRQLLEQPQVSAVHQNDLKRFEITEGGIKYKIRDLFTS